jgi:hypothetical protein
MATVYDVVAAGAQPVPSAKVGGSGAFVFSDGGFYAYGPISALRVWVNTDRKLINA